MKTLLFADSKGTEDHTFVTTRLGTGWVESVGEEVQLEDLELGDLGRATILSAHVGNLPTTMSYCYDNHALKDVAVYAKIPTLFEILSCMYDCPVNETTILTHLVLKRC